MGNIMNNWQGIKNGMNLSLKFLDKIKPEYALKNRINGAEKQMESQITRLDQAHSKLKQNHDNIFKKIVEAKLTREESKARTYAIELQEIRKIKNKISDAKLAMEQIKLRLGTVSEFPWYDGDITSDENDESVNKSPNVFVKSCIDECISGINREIDGASPLINDIHGLNVTTISPSSETVPSLSFICSIANFASPILFFIFLISCNSIAYVLAFDSSRVNFASTIFLKI